MNFASNIQLNGFKIYPIEISFCHNMNARNLIWLVICLLSAGNRVTLGQSVSSDTLTLQFDRVAQPPACYYPHKIVYTPRIGLALSGGGARGFAQIGVLQALEENNIPIDAIVGTSMGSIVGGLYAVGYSATQLEEIAKSIQWNEIMSDRPPRTSLFMGQKEEGGRAMIQMRFKDFKLALPQAITPGQKLTAILTSLTLRADQPISYEFDQFRIPFRAVACDLISGQKVVISHGNLAEAMKASSAVPLLLSPVIRDSMWLVDGGLINNIPVDEVKELDVDLVIAVDTVSKLRPRDGLAAPWEIADQVTSIMQREKNAAQRQKADVLIQVPLDDYKSDSFDNIGEMIQLGKRAAQDHVETIKHFLRSQTADPQPAPLRQVAAISVQCPDSLLQQLAEQIIQLRIRQQATKEAVYLSLVDIYRTGYFDDARSVVTMSDSSLTINYLLAPNPHLDTIIIKGNTIFPDSMLRAQVQSERGRPINYQQSQEDISRIIQLYKKNGYALAKISSIDLINGRLTIGIDEGIISAIVITGAERTHSYVLLREFPLKAGDIFNINKADEGINNIHSTDLFATVALEVIPREPHAELHLKVQEKAFRVLRMSYRYDLERQSIGLLELVDENILGSGNQLTLHSQYGQRHQVIKLQFRADRVFRSFIANKAEVFHQRHKHFYYDEGQQIGQYWQQHSGISLSVGQQIKRLGLFSIYATLESIELREISGSGYPTGRSDLKTIALQSIVDTQDRVPFPRRGKYYQFFYKLSSATFLGSQTSFVKLYSSLELFETFLKRNTIHPRLYWGTSDQTTPFIEQFRLGGQSSFYGLHEDERIGRHIIAGSLEYRYRTPFRLPIDLFWSCRYDLGGIWKNSQDINPQDFIHGLGTAIELRTPIGPMALAIGRATTARTVFYFSAGYHF